VWNMAERMKAEKEAAPKKKSITSLGKLTQALGHLHTRTHTLPTKAYKCVRE